MRADMIGAAPREMAPENRTGRVAGALGPRY